MLPTNEPLPGRAPRAPGPRSAADEISARVIAAAAADNEIRLSAARAAFAAAILLRSVFVTEWSNARAAIGIPALGTSIIVSGALVLAPRGRRLAAHRRFGIASVTLDSVLCFLTLLPMALWPEDARVAIIAKVDAASPMLVVAAAAFRLSVPVCVLSAVLNAGSLLLLACFDRSGAWSAADRHFAALHLMLLAAAGTVAALLAHRARALVVAGATAAREAERVSWNLAVVLQEHHGLRTQLAAASVNLDLAEDSLGDTAGGGARRRPFEARQLLAAARRSLRTVNRTILGIAELGYDELERRDLVAGADLSVAIHRARRLVARQFPHATTHVRGLERVPELLVAGGTSGLAAMVESLLLNAAEAVGRAAPAEIAIVVAGTGSAEVMVSVVDDGPGLPAPVIAAPPGASRFTTKGAGRGGGLAIVRRIAVASGGAVELANRSEGGAEVRLRLRASPIHTDEHR